MPAGRTWDGEMGVRQPHTPCSQIRTVPLRLLGKDSLPPPPTKASDAFLWWLLVELLPPPSPPGCWAGPPLHGAGGKGARQATQDAERDSQRLHRLGGSGRRRGGLSAPPWPGVEERGSIQVSEPLHRAWLPSQAECWGLLVGEIITTQHMLGVRHSSKRLRYLC